MNNINYSEILEQSPLLHIKNICADVSDTRILNGLDLDIYSGEIHVIMGPNGCGKSTLSKILAGHPAYNVISGDIELCGKDIMTMTPEERSHAGLFLAFQYPVEIPGVSNFDFLRAAYNEKEKSLGKEEIGPMEFMTIFNEKSQALKIPSDFGGRDLNDGFSGGEKKRNEILQMLLLQPQLVILDEIDSGLDVDALKVICANLRTNLPEKTSLLIITHYQKILDYLPPTTVHIMKHGKIVKTGSKDLVYQLNLHGYDFFANTDVKK